MLGQQATMEDVREWLIEGHEMLVSRDEAFGQEMEALNARLCGLVEAQKARERKLKFAKDNLVMLENVRREKEVEVIRLIRVFASLPKNLLLQDQDKVSPAGDSCGVKRKWDGSRDQTRQPNHHSTPIKKVPLGSQHRLSQDSHSVKKKWGEIQNQQLYPSREQMSTPKYKLPPRSQHQLSHDSHIMKKKWGEMSTPNDKLPPRSQPVSSHESYTMKRKLGDRHLSASGEQERLVGFQPSQDLKPQSMRSSPVAGGVVQEIRQESKEMSKSEDKGLKSKRQEAVQGGRMFYDASLGNQGDGPMMRRKFHEQARTPFKDWSSAKSPSLSQPRPTQRVSSSIRQNFHSGATSALTPLQRSTKISPVVAEIQNKCAPLRVTSSGFYLKSILKKK